MAGHAGRWVAPNCMPVLAADHRIEVPGQDFHGLFDDPLAALRQAAASYPSIAIRLIDTYAGVVKVSTQANPGFADHLAALALAMKDHAIALAEHDSDRAAIARAYAEGFASDGAAAA